VSSSARNGGEGLLHNILVLNIILAWISFFFFQALKDKGEGRCYSEFRPEGVEVLEKAEWWFGEVSSEFGLVRDRFGDVCMHDANSWII
jgi:hypothetical protein